jgi:hypothetical protein
MANEITSPNDLDPKGKAKLVLDMFHRIMVHHTLWFTEVRHQMGSEKALDVLQSQWKTSLEIQMKRLSKTLGFELEDGIPAPLLNLPNETMDKLINTMGINWLVNDGVWFQSVEFAHGMNDAKRCNDSCWAHYSPFEAWSIKQFLNLPERPGLDGLKKALNFRMYGSINVQSINDETRESFVFQMNQCRVQAARKRKGLDDYPCKTVGLVEYPYFARAIDDRIETECVGCPPDDHPEEWFCAWKFRLKDA